MSQVEVVPLDEHRARQLTDRIKDAAGQLWQLLAEAHDGRAWAALGYDSFKAYVETEFGMARSRAYQLIDQARVIAAVTAAAGVSTNVDISEWEARDLKPHLDLVVENVRDATVDTEPELKAEAAQAAIEETREFIRQREPKPIPKPDVGGGISHPARFSADLLPVFAGFLEPGWKVLDPFAGVGGIHALEDLVSVDAVGVEIEPKWAKLHAGTICGSALDMDFPDEFFDAIVTSPTYGNRLADNHEAADPESRRSYRHDLGEPLDPANSGAMQWGPKYRDFHINAWEETLRVLRPAGTFVLNIKDHIRGGEWQDVVAWHTQTLIDLGCKLIACRPVVTPHLRHGANAEARVAAEMVMVFQKEIGR